MISAREAEFAALERERDIGAADEKRIEEVKTAIAAARDRLKLLEEQWAAEKATVEDIRNLRTKIAEGGVEGAEEARAKLMETIARLETIAPEKRMIYPYVDAQAVAAVVSDWTGIPVGRMMKDEVQAILSLADILTRRVIGQAHGLAMIARRIETNRAKLDNPNKPIGVFMLAGPSGVGKTETALALAEALYGGEQNMITINMSEFQEAHTVSTLKGAPPDYVGYGEGGRLTEVVRRKPYSVVLLDEVENAHPDVHEIFFQVFDKGQMEDGTGRRIRENHEAAFIYDDAVVAKIVSMCNDPDSGGRMVDNIVTNTLLPALSRQILNRSMAREGIEQAKVAVKEGEFVYGVS